jgi:predicted acetyltransferase
MKTSDAQRLIVQAPDTTRHEEMLDLIAKTFSPWHGYWPFLNYCRQGYLDHSHYDPAASRIGLLDEKVVTNWTVYDHRMRIGSCAVRVGGIGVVATHGEYRKRGLMLPTGMGSIRAMRDLGYDMTTLFGLHNFYHHFGYVRMFSEQSYTIGTAELPAGGAASALRKFSQPLKELDAVYNRACDGLTGTAVRPTFPQARISTHDQPAPVGYLWSSKSGQPAGYVVVADRGNSHLEIAEAIGEPAQVLAVLAKLAKQFRLPEIRMGGLHYDSPLAIAFRRLSCRVETQYVRNGGAMVRTVNLRSTLAKIAPELSRRLAASMLRDWKGRLLIADSREKVTLQIVRSKVALAEGADAPNSIRGGEEIAQLIVGVDEPFEVVGAGKIRLAGQAKDLLPVLFPNQHPMLASWDRF